MSAEPKTCGCGHAARTHFPACVAILHRTTNRHGGGTTTLCGCPAFGSPTGAALGRKRVRKILWAVENELFDRAFPGFGPLASGYEAQSVIAEECHELTSAIWFGVDQKGRPSDPRAEAVQLAAMAVRYLLDVREQGE